MTTSQAGELAISSAIEHVGYDDDAPVMTARQAAKDILFGSVRL